MDKFSTLDKSEAISLLETRISSDLTDALGAYVEVKFNNSLHNIFVSDFDLIEDFIDYKDIKFEVYTEAYDILETSGSKILKAKSSLLRSNCRVTNQPDWGDVFIYMKGDSVPSYESLLQYIVSMRKENHFHEEICECIYQRLFNIFSPEDLLVGCLYTRRGGIDINPLRSSSVELLDRYFSDYLDLNNIYKTLRQ
jgi:7-cyano-7-deazaguanine reductase